MVHEPVAEVLLLAHTRLVNLRPGYRVRQFWGALGSASRPVDEALLGAYLNTAQIALFRRMSAAEQIHALAVLRTLEVEQGTGPEEGVRTRSAYVETVLAQAALLHDVGKVGGRIRLWHRAAKVVLQALHPALLDRLAVDEPRSWRYSFFVLLHHAERGADLSAGAGTDAVAVALIRAHHMVPAQSGLAHNARRSSGLDAPGQALLMALQRADEQN
jgi:hypothetical protein